METTSGYATGMKRFVALSLAALLLASGCRKETEAAAPAEPAAPAAVAKPEGFDVNVHRQEIGQWQARRADGLRKEDSWLTLVGLHWLEEGANSFGSGAKGKVVLPPSAPASAGTLTLTAGRVTLEPAVPMTVDGKPVEKSMRLLADADENGPTVVQMGSYRFNVIRRGDRFGLRVKDSNAPTRLHFQGLEYYPIDSKWRVEAKLEPYQPVKKVRIQDVTGMVQDYESPGSLVFTIDGKEYRLDPMREEERLFIIFKDETSRDTTYPAGRYLYSDMPGPDGKVIVDFNRAYNPPCAFTDFATCPLPPPQNRLALRVEAGEKKVAGGH